MIDYAVVCDFRRPSTKIVDPLPDDAKILVDDGTLGCTNNHLRAWEVLAEVGEHGWGVVLEDDAIPCPNFTRQVEEMLAAAPTPVVSLYLGKGRPPGQQTKIARAVATDAPYILSTRLFHAVGVAVRTDCLIGPRGMLQKATEAARSSLRKPIDEAITEWATAEAIPITYCNPSLVDHDVSLPSIAKHRPEEEAFQSERVAHNFNVHRNVAWYGKLAII